MTCLILSLILWFVTIPTAFSGPIPSTLGQLSHLVILGAEFNDFSGTIPTEFGLLTEMVHVSTVHLIVIGNHQIQATLTKHMILQLFLYSFPRMTGSLPSELGLLSNAEWFCKCVVSCLVQILVFTVLKKSSSPIGRH